MAKPELGTKRVCVSCGARFYDLTKQPAVCPKCGTEQPAEQPRLRRTGGNLLEEKRRPKVLPVPGIDEADVEVEAPEEEVEEDVLEDTSDLEDGDAGIAEVGVEPEPGEEER
ncbi:MAG: TIGR02300 family protein [Rhodospirillales bacterium]|nr:TIGR02300 family protein [Rhodospirillales bacterium]